MVIVSLFAALFARLWYLQILDSEQFRIAATNNQVRIVYEPAPRGRILDRHGQVIVDNRASQVVTVSRAELEEDDEVLPRLAALLGVPLKDLQTTVNDPRFSPYRPVPVAEDVSEEVIVYIRERQDLFPGVEATQLAQRAYPYGTLAAHLVGYVGEVNDKELEERERLGYRLGDEIGKSGVERAYEDVLRGTPGIRKLEVNADGKVLRTLAEQPPVAGDDLQLTIDLDIQILAEQSLAEGLGTAKSATDRERKSGFAAPAGSVVVMDPRDGSVIAMASFPTYDPAEFVNGIRSDVYEQLQDPKNYFPLTNRAIQGQYAPGSTFKLVTAVAGLQHGLLQPNTSVVDRGSLRVGNRTFRNAQSRSYGSVDLRRALVVSSDVYFYQLGWNFWTQRDKTGDGIQEAARQMGFGAKTGIPLEGEAKGRVPDPKSRAELHEQNPDAYPEGRWFAGDNVNLAIGQGELVVTPLQLANAYCTFANGGTVYRPRVAVGGVDPNGIIVDPVAVEEIGSVDVPGAGRAAILAGLEGAVASGEGTAHAAFSGFPVSKFSVAGKTGTAQVAGKQDSALFAAFGPSSSPQYVVTVVMEEAGFGGVAAAPVARRIFEGLAGVEVSPVSLGGGVD